MKPEALEAPAYGAVTASRENSGRLERPVDRLDESGERPNRIMRADKILVVEDETAFAQVVELYLRRLGYNVTGVVDRGEDALRKAAEIRPDLALLDIEIQGTMDGLDLAEEFGRQFNIPVIFLTGRSDEGTLERVRRSGSYGYLLKPFRPEELKAGIELAFIRHGHERHLRQIEQSFTAAVKSIGDAVIMTDVTGTVTYMNPAAERLTGWPARTATGQELNQVFQVRGGPGVVRQMFQQTQKGAFVHETILLTAAGREVPIEANVSAIFDDAQGIQGAVLIFRDVTERKHFESELKKSQGELRQLTGHLEAAREAERTRIAREIHDEFGQTLTGLKMNVAWLQKKLSDPAAASTDRLLAKVQSMDELLREMVKSVRRIAAELRPGILDDLGLAAAVEWQVKEFQHRTGIRAEVRTVLKQRELPQTVATVLFRVLQESLTNVARHAEASLVRVQLREHEDWVVLEVVDDGRGITNEELNKRGAFGLMGMRERVIPLQGRCEIQGQPGQGTTVRISVPLERQNHAGNNHD